MGSRPVVSVSRTISRIMAPNSPGSAAPATAHDSATCLRAASSPRGCRPTKSAFSRFSASGIWAARMAANLPRHARSRQHPLPLKLGRRRDDHRRRPRSFRRRSRTAAVCRAPRPRAPAGPVQERRPRLAHQRPDDPVQPLERLGVAQHALGEQLAIDGAVHHHAGEGRLDRRDRRAARRVEAPHLGVGVIDVGRRVGEHLRGGRLAHADRAGEADEDQWALQGGEGQGATSTAGGAHAEEAPQSSAAPGRSASPARPRCGGLGPRARASKPVSSGR